MKTPLHSVYSVLSVVRRFFNHRLHRLHGVGTAARIQEPKPLLHSVYSVHSVVQIFNHRMHRMHGVGAAALIQELNEGLMA